LKSEKWYAAMAARKGKGTNQYTKAKELGLPKPEIADETREKLSNNWKGRKHSQKTKDILSEKRKKFLQDNPDKVPYLLNHKSKGPSYPEIYWKDVLDSEDLKYHEQYSVGTYSLDFAFPGKKIDLEIDGEQHYVDPRIVEHDKKRTQFLEENGWKIIRVRWSEYLKLDDKKEFVSSIIEELK
jgi:very-short-patch-repair endonuclease